MLAGKHMIFVLVWNSKFVGCGIDIDDWPGIVAIRLKKANLFERKSKNSNRLDVMVSE